MISVHEAKKLIALHAARLAEVERPIIESLNKVLAHDILSPFDLPLFDQSAMDGYAVCLNEGSGSGPCEIVGESAAGAPYRSELKPGQTVRIFTGAQIPRGANAVLMQEKSAVENGKLIIQDASLEKGSNIRKKGSQVRSGEKVLEAGHVIGPGSIGLLATLGFNQIRVIGSPRITLVVTGNELQAPGTQLGEGEIYESNSYCIHAALLSAGCSGISILHVRDDEKKTTEQIGKALQHSDIVIATGGISVGKYDFVGQAFFQSGVENIFYKIAQKPGKPLFFGKKNSCLVFGLPGNPAAALTCFYEYVFPALRIQLGHHEIHFPVLQAETTDPISKKEGLANFLKARFEKGKVTVLPGQDSGNISSFAQANCLVYLPATQGPVDKGQLVEIHLFS